MPACPKCKGTGTEWVHPNPGTSLCGHTNPCSTCGGTGIEPSTTTVPISYTVPSPPTPQNCVRFIYGQGCYGCQRNYVCWPTVTTTGFTVEGDIK